ncbi:XdhC family aldehyde oxidoreductase maturation factor [Clostridium formicaceticum]|uniref:Xanthine dehydrogenase subunit A n=1 Tax=Clostridium formicaceticum TaxID=1497 RepID=A0AAC9RJJ4_9CLOT|nr:XdhC/CoxI family protein [Clostridium formicaceticum]AOY76458.1 hypothetical protein BJL90_11395 [Clostridium formicaceticum]ARE86857.1 putative xanthine dehydrogenase subunit A [Clostridium formicaceticum]
MMEILNQLMQMVDERENFVLATIVDMDGSTPRGKGSKMVIRRDGSIFGTVGGGKIEALTIQLAKETFQDKKTTLHDFSLSSKDASSIGMVCGGHVKMLIEFIDLSNEAVFQIFLQAIKLVKEQKNFTILTKLADDSAGSTSEKWIYIQKEACYEGWGIPKEVTQASCGEDIKIIEHNKDIYIVEPFCSHEKVIILGAGHVGKAVAEVTKMLDFRTIVVDDREEFANKKRFPTADEVCVVDSLNNILDTIEIDNRSYAIIVTRGHLYDKVVLAQLLKTNAKYIGMIGSRTKTNIILKELLEEGYASSDIERVYAPIGIKIFAETPEEIAVSIAAELIKVRRQPHDA